MTTNKSVGRSHMPQKTAGNCGYVGVHAKVSTVGLLANKYIALNHEWNAIENYAERTYKTFALMYTL